MKKHRIAKIREAAGTDEKEVSPEQLKQAREWIADKLLEIVVKTPKDAAPVKESFSELLAEFHTPKRSPVIINHADGRRIRYGSGNAEIITPEKMSEKNFTDINSGGSEKSSDENSTFDKRGAFTTTGFDNEQLELLRKIQNGE